MGSPPDRYSMETLKLQISEEHLRELLSRRSGGIMFDENTVRVGGAFVFAFFEINSSAAIVVYSSQIDRPPVPVKLLVVPIHHAFELPAGLEARPLGALMHPSQAVFALYEVTDAGN